MFFGDTTEEIPGGDLLCQKEKRKWKMVPADLRRQAIGGLGLGPGEILPHDIVRRSFQQELKKPVPNTVDERLIMAARGCAGDSGNPVLFQKVAEVLIDLLHQRILGSPALKDRRHGGVPFPEHVPIVKVCCIIVLPASEKAVEKRRLKSRRPSSFRS